MNRIKIGVLCPSDIAFRRFMPALKSLAHFEYIGLAAATEREFSGTGSNKVKLSELEKATRFHREYGGKIFEGYENMLTSEEIDAVYIPLPPALHFNWAKKALESGKHVLLEKPFTTNWIDTKILIDLAKIKNLAVHENYMFVYHSQLDFIREQILNGAIGSVRLIRIDFGFPFRGACDFRYDKKMGGGALLDCGGYTIKLASLFLGESTKITTSQLNFTDGSEVDIYGSATLTNKEGLTAQVSFGMDNSYKCDLEIWGSKGTLYTNRVLTAPAGMKPAVAIKTSEGERVFELSSDDTFAKSIMDFAGCIASSDKKKAKFAEILEQSRLIDAFEKEVNYG